jgi:hypothetical protein
VVIINDDNCFIGGGNSTDTGFSEGSIDAEAAAAVVDVVVAVSVHVVFVLRSSI